MTDDSPRVEPLQCADCGGTIGTVEIDADGMHGDPILRESKGTFSFSGHYTSGRLILTCEECSDS